MDSGHFDQFTRGLGEGRSRRGVLKVLGAAALGAVGIAGHRRGVEAAPPPRVGVCHRTGNANIPYSYIMVSPSMATTLEKRGDWINIDLTSDVNNCGSCAHSCWDETPDGGGPVCNDGTCGFECFGGTYDDGNGNCVWDPLCLDYSFEEPTCFHMETESGNYCWVPVDYANDLETCRSWDGCAPGGGGGDACYKWSTSSHTVIWPDENGWPT